MEPLRNCRIWSMVFLSTLVADYQSDDNLFESTTAVSVTTVYHGTSSHKIYSADNGLQAVQFAQIKWTNLTADMAKGQGEYLSAMANLLAVKPVQKPAFFKMTKAKFSQLFSSTEVTPEQLLKSLQTEVSQLNA